MALESYVPLRPAWAIAHSALTMNNLVNIALTTVVALALLNLLWTGLKTKRSTLNTVWALFCGSLALVMLDRAMGEALGAIQPLTQIAAGGACGIFWLVARSLFRSGNAIGTPHWLLVAAILASSAVAPMLAGSPWLSTEMQATITTGLWNFQLLLSSTAMVLSAWEGLNGWHAGLERRERTLRIAYFATIAGCVALTQAVNPPANASQALLDLQTALHAICASLVLLVAGAAVAYRNRHPLLARSNDRSEIISRKAPTAEDRGLAARIESEVREQSLYLQPELKVASLAELLATPDYKISRAITRALDCDNFNQYINRYRIEFAQRLLGDHTDRSILAIGIDSGFASIGPFNRAFKATTGVTPRQFRAQAATGPLKSR